MFCNEKQRGTISNLNTVAMFRAWLSITSHHKCDLIKDFDDAHSYELLVEIRFLHIIKLLLRH